MYLTPQPGGAQAIAVRISDSWCRTHQSSPAILVLPRHTLCAVSDIPGGKRAASMNRR
jgi:hypothetical protein